MSFKCLKLQDKVSERDSSKVRIGLKFKNLETCQILLVSNNILNRLKVQMILGNLGHKANLVTVNSVKDAIKEN